MGPRNVGSSGQPSLHRQVSQGATGGPERGRGPDNKSRGEQISELRDFRDNFNLAGSGPPSFSGPSSIVEQSRGQSDRGSYNQPQQYHPQHTAIVSVSANPGGGRDQSAKQPSPKQGGNSSTGAGPPHTTHHQLPYSQHHGPEGGMGMGRGHSRSPPTPSTSSKGSSPPSLASVNPDIPSLQNQKRYSPPSHGNNVATAANIPVASIIGKQPGDHSNTMLDATTPPTPTVAVASVSPDSTTLSLNSGTMVSAISTSDSTLTSTSVGSASSQATVATTTSNIAKKSTLNPNAKEFVLNPTAKAFVPQNTIQTPAPVSVHRPPSALTPQQTHPQRPITPGQNVSGQPVAVQYNAHPAAAHFQVHPHSAANFSAVSGGQGSPSVATVHQSHPQMQGPLIQYIPNPAAYASSHLAAQAVVQQVQGAQVAGQGQVVTQGSGVPPSYATPQHFGITGATPTTVGPPPPPHAASAQQQQVQLQVRYPRSGPGNSAQGNVPQTPPTMQQSSQPNQPRGQAQGTNDVTSPSVLAATGQPILAPPNSQTPGGLPTDSQQPNIAALGYHQMFNPQMTAAHLIQATNPAGATGMMMRLPNGAVVPIPSSMAQMTANNPTLQQSVVAAQQAHASATTGLPPPPQSGPPPPQQSSDQTQQNSGPGSLPPPGGMSLPSPGGNVVTWVPQHHGAQPQSVIPGPPPSTSGIGAPPGPPPGQPIQGQPPPPSSGAPIPPPGQQQSGGQSTPAPSPGPAMMYSVQPPGGIAAAAAAHHGQSNTQSLHFTANYPSGVVVLPPNHAAPAGMHAIHHQTIMSQAGSMPVQPGQPVTSMPGAMPPPIHHYMQHQPGVQGRL